jgi:cation transport ATPase
MEAADVEHEDGMNREVGRSQPHRQADAEDREANIAFALSVKGIVLLLGAGGIATMWAAVFADAGVAVLAVLNALRVLKPRKAGQR